jgi:hypothetical protein
MFVYKQGFLEAGMRGKLGLAFAFASDRKARKCQ